jgi:maleate cis-trans isomerase
MAIEYGAQGVIGVLTPQANTTVEPELWALAPAHVSLLNARLTSDKSTIEERLVDYTERFAKTSEQFANAPILSIAAACTGASYLIGAEQEAQIVARVEAERGVAFITAALASVAALRAMGANKIALLSPYPGALDEACAPYWEGHGFEVVAKAGPALETEAFHPIYAMAGGGVFKAYEELSQSSADAVLMLGTGMATLRPILAGRDRGLLPAVSCNIALMWAAAQARRWDALQGEDLPAFLNGTHWEARLNALFPL